MPEATATRTTVHVETEIAGQVIPAVWEFADPAEAARMVDRRMDLRLITRVTRLDFPDVDAEVEYFRVILASAVPSVSAEAMADMLARVREHATARIANEKAPGV